MQTPTNQMLVRNVPTGPVRRKQSNMVDNETVFQTPVKRQRVIDPVNGISPPKGKRRVERRLVF